MDRHHWNVWERMRTRLIGPYRELAIPALVAATLFHKGTGEKGTGEPNKGRDTAKAGDDSEGARKDVAA